MIIIIIILKIKLFVKKIIYKKTTEIDSKLIKFIHNFLLVVVGGFSLSRGGNTVCDCKTFCTSVSIYTHTHIQKT